MWQNFFNKIYVINLEKRIDRWCDVVEEMQKWDIDFVRKAAIEHEKGAIGLLMTVNEIFNEAIREGYENILIFEDDAKWIEGVDVDDTMNKVVEQLPQDYLICFLGCQPSKGYTHFHSPNLLPVTGAYATHGAAYSRKGIELILASNLDAPIDNHYVNHIQEPYGNCYQVHPFLCTQKADVSNIGGQYIDWSPFLQQRHEQKIIELRNRTA